VAFRRGEHSSAAARGQFLKKTSPALRGKAAAESEHRK